LNKKILYSNRIIKDIIFPKERKKLGQEALTAKLIQGGVLKSSRIIEAFLNVDRADFVPAGHKADAYIDRPLPLAPGATISQPTTVAFMLEILSPSTGEKVLDVGSGSGWTTALIAECVGEKGMVFGTEIIKELVDFGQKNLNQYEYYNAGVTKAEEGALGLPKEAPFDKILVSASGKKLPKELLGQLKNRGVMVIPVGNSVLKVIKTSEEDYDIQEFPGFAFVPLK
jgi:protein-L-isoaspartate(D-aspartate) O-methyltransferase